jgi:ABC-type glycerol-3-phosphate transport system substrate-binding protein
MKRDFEWTFAEDGIETEAAVAPPPGRVRGPFWFMATAVFITLILLLSWAVGRRQLAQAEVELTQQVQAALDNLREAQAAGDVERFLILLDDDPDWRAGQLHPAWHEFYSHELRVTRAQPYGSLLQANVAWEENDHTYHRLLFFRIERGLPRLSAADPDYWGTARRSNHAWGALQYGDSDELWVEAIAGFVAELLDQFCLAPCSDVTVSLQPHWEETAVPHTIYIPSPRLVAIDEQGQPAPHFWELLENRLADRVALTTVRFAVPETAVPMDYERIAADFMAQQPRIQVEIIRLPTPQSPTPNPQHPVLNLQFDGAAQTPTLAQLQAGQIYDLTPFVNSDPTYDTLDYYAQIWAGVWWQERIWMLPQAAQMRLLFYDKAAYAAQGLPEPLSLWTWDDLVADLTQLADGGHWGLLDPGPDLLLSYAYDQAGCYGRFAMDDCRRPLSACDVLVTQGRFSQIRSGGCIRPLSLPFINAAWRWYLDLVAAPEATPGLLVTPLDTPNMDREQILNNWQSARRQAAIWVDEPVNYEHRLLLDPLGVVGFPSSDLFEGVTPLWVMGNYISGESKRPYATWQWLTYLDQQQPNRPRRLIPARPSIAHASGYWVNLPPSLGRTMRSVFPFAQPVHFEEQQLFTREEITAVLTGNP